MLPPITLDPQAQTPLYRQLADCIRDHIETGRMARGERLPATRELAGLLGLNRATISAAYEILESGGFVRGHVGRGSFVDGRPKPDAEPGIDWALFRSKANPPASVGPAAISFATSRPASELFPLEEFRETCREVIDSPDPAEILQLGSPLGYAPLRSYLLQDARPGSDVLITSGCQQAIDLLQRVLIAPGDAVVLEDPVYPGLKNVFAPAGARVIGVPVGPSGIEIETLERTLHAERPRVLAVTPNFQNPTGATMPLSARQALLKAARRNGTIVVENNIYGELRYDGAPIPTLKDMDESGDVVLLGSFSKISFPGLRVGWVLGPAPLIARMAEAKQWCDLHSDQLSQAVLYRFARSGRLAAHRERVIQAGRMRLEAVLESCEAFLPPGSRFTRPRGGMSLWVRLPEALDSGELSPRAERAGVNYLPGRYFAVSRIETSSLRLSFAGVPPEQIREGVAILGRVFNEELERVKSVRRLDGVPAMV